MKLRVSIPQFLADAERIASALERDGRRLSKATAGRIDAGHADELRTLVAKVRQIEASRARTRGGSLTAHKLEAERLVSRITAAARWAGEHDPVLAARIARVATESRVRGAPIASLPLSLVTWKMLVDKHRSQLAPLLGDTPKRLDAITKEIVEGLAAQKETKATSTRTLADRDTALARIGEIVRGARIAFRLLEIDL